MKNNFTFHCLRLDVDKKKQGTRTNPFLGSDEGTSYRYCDSQLL